MQTRLGSPQRPETVKPTVGSELGTTFPLLWGGQLPRLGLSPHLRLRLRLPLRRQHRTFRSQGEQTKASLPPEWWPEFSGGTGSDSGGSYAQNHRRPTGRSSNPSTPVPEVPLDMFQLLGAISCRLEADVHRNPSPPEPFFPISRPPPLPPPLPS